MKHPLSGAAAASENGFCGVTRDEFQREFKHSGQIFGVKGNHTPSGLQALTTTAPRSLIILRILSWFSERAECFQMVQSTYWAFPELVLGPCPKQSFPRPSRVLGHFPS